MKSIHDFAGLDARAAPYALLLLRLAREAAGSIRCGYTLQLPQSELRNRKK